MSDALPADFGPPFEPTIHVAGERRNLLSCTLGSEGEVAVFAGYLDRYLKEVGFRLARIPYLDGVTEQNILYRWYTIDNGPLICVTNVPDYRETVADHRKFGIFVYDRRGSSGPPQASGFVPGIEACLRGYRSGSR